MSSERRPLLVAAGAATLVALAGGAMTRPGAWYDALEKSALTPPDWAFAPAWTVIYAFAVLAAVWGWSSATTFRQRSWLIVLFFFNAILNVAWSFLFFTLQRPDWALAEVLTLWISVLALIVFLARFEKRAAWALFPYLAWVSFAGYLNLRVVQLNGAFG